MKRVFAALFTIALATPAAAEKLSLDVLSEYLTGLRAVQGDFVQHNSDGTTSQGTIYIKRPGRIRFEYEPPETALVLAMGGQLAIFDPRSDQGPDRYPLSQTPLNLILKDVVDLGDAEMVVGHTLEGSSTVVTAQDPDNPEYGSIKLYFGGEPLVLRQWVITDNAGGETRMQLTKLRLGGDIPNRLFNIQAAMRDWKP